MFYDFLDLLFTTGFNPTQEGPAMFVSITHLYLSQRRSEPICPFCCRSTLRCRQSDTNECADERAATFLEPIRWACCWDR